MFREKSENCHRTDFKMGVAATLPELSEWTFYGDVRAIYLGPKSSLSAVFLGKKFYLRTFHVFGLNFCRLPFWGFCCSRSLANAH